MNSDQNFHTSPIVEQVKFNTQLLSTSTIVKLVPNQSPVSSPRSSINNQNEFPHISSRNRIPFQKISIINLRNRLCVREFYYTRLALVSDIMCILGMVGIILMVIENELTFAYINNQDSKVSWFIKLIISITTVVLLILILYYHYLDMTLYYFRNLIEDWRVELKLEKILLIITELSICAVHPMPRAFPYTNPETINSNSTDLGSVPLSYTAVDVGLGLPMFLRVYLIGRCMMLHSHLVRNVSLRSFGYLNQVSIDFHFLIRTYLEQWPTRCISVLFIGAFLIGSWSMRACDHTGTQEHMSMGDAMWLFIITFTTIGYGDFYPTTYCGRTIATLIGLFGVVLSALLIAIVTRKLLLTREEKYVHTFILNTELAEKRRNYAANVIKFAVKVWYLKRHNQYASVKYLQTYRKFFQAINYLQKTREKKRNLADTCVGLIELMHAQHKTDEQIEETAEKITAIQTEMTIIKDELNNINRNMQMLQQTLQVFFEKDTK